MPMTFTKFGLALAGLAFSATVAFAQQPAFKPAVVYDLGGKFDKSFNEGVHSGAEKYKNDTGTDYRDFACGYVQGVKYAKKDAEVFQNMTGTTGAAWNDPVKGGELAKSQIDRGADVIYHAAGGTGIGVLRATADAGKLGIGVDSNQNALHPGKVLTSMLKRVDNATFKTFQDAKDGSWKAGATTLGLKEDGVGWADDEANKPLITPEMRAAVERAAADIKSGAVTVHDYMATQNCPGM